MNVLHRSGLTLIMLLIATSAFGQITLRGTVKDAEGTKLPSAHIQVLPDSTTGTSNNQGEFIINTTLGIKSIAVSYVGYEVCNMQVNLRRDTTITINMRPSVNQLKEVVISGQREHLQELLDGNRTSTNIITQDEINSIPVLGGEADVIKTLQLLPGTIRGVEGTSDLFVRGGAADQNLVLLDGATIYNTSHLFGFLSVFNPDMLEKVESINGGFPAEFGGRLSSILNVETLSDIPERTHVSGDIGLISSRLFVEQPLINNKLSVWVAGRRTYIDQVLKTIDESLPYFFYDLNGKILFRPTAKDKIEASYYGGKDILDYFRDRNNDGDGYLTTFESGNTSQSLKWTHALPQNASLNVALFRTTYLYNIRNIFEENELVARSDIEDYGARLLLQKDSLPFNGILKAGVDWVRHAVSPNLINTAGSFAEFVESSATSARSADEISAHGQYELDLNSRTRMNAGLRVSSGWIQGNDYVNAEPRLSFRYALRKDEALKLSYSRMVQYLHRISNSAISSPTDIWYPVTDSIRPQTSHQIAMAYQRRLRNPTIYLSAEVYYKTMNHLIGYEEGTNLFFNTDFESKLIQGKGRAYGLELLLKKEAGKFTGWLSYTLSWSHRQFDEINTGTWFPSRYDRRHNGSLVMQYAVSKRLSISLVWEFISGARFTPVIGQYVVLAPSLTGADLIPVYSGINAVKLADTHRLDLGMKFRSKPTRKFQWHWFVGVYNVYNRANPVGINIVQDEEDNSLRYEQPGLFGLLPFISYGFKL